MQDVIIVGGGPAGLVAATYLGRFLRPALVLDDGGSRAQWIPTSHNIPGFARGIGGVELLEELKAQALRYGASIRSAAVSSVSSIPAGFSLQVGAERLEARFIVLATGAADNFPPVAEMPAAVLRGVLRVCPICDGFEARDKKIAVIGDGPQGGREAEFLSTYSSEITYVHIGKAMPAELSARMQQAGVQIVIARAADLEIGAAGLRVNLPARTQHFDVAYSALGCQRRNAFARSLGAACDERGALVVGEHQETSVPGLYAAGDVVRGLNQVVVAAAEAAIAATDIHNKLRVRT